MRQISGKWNKDFAMQNQEAATLRSRYQSPSVRTMIAIKTTIAA
jgi:hypothetical protein